MCLCLWLTLVKEVLPRLHASLKTCHTRGCHARTILELVTDILAVLTQADSPALAVPEVPSLLPPLCDATLVCPQSVVQAKGMETLLKNAIAAFPTHTHWEVALIAWVPQLPEVALAHEKRTEWMSPAIEVIERFGPSLPALEKERVKATLRSYLVESEFGVWDEVTIEKLGAALVSLSS